MTTSLGHLRAAAALSVAGLALVLSACTGSAKPPIPRPSSPVSSTGSSSTSTVTATADPAAMLAFTPGSAAATMSGKLSSAYTVDNASIPATATIYSVRTGPAGTVLTWALSATSTAYAAGLSTSGLMYDQVTLVDVKGNKRYSLVTSGAVPNMRCACSYSYAFGPAPVVLGALYPPLPPDATSVRLDIPRFTSATIPVTR